jgi:hypothetical protein
VIILKANNFETHIRNYTATSTTKYYKPNIYQSVSIMYYQFLFLIFSTDLYHSNILRCQKFRKNYKRFQFIPHEKVFVTKNIKLMLFILTANMNPMGPEYLHQVMVSSSTIGISL